MDTVKSVRLATDASTCPELEILQQQLRVSDWSLRVIEPATLPPDEQDGLINAMYEIAVDSFGGGEQGNKLPYGAIDGRTREATAVLVIEDSTGYPIGYTVNDAVQTREGVVNYFNTALMRTSVQGRGTYGPLNRYRAALFPAAGMITRTQNPIVLRGMRKLQRELEARLYPDHEGTPTDVSEMLMELFPDSELLCEPGAVPTVVQRGVYTWGALMDETPPPREGLEKQVWRNLNIGKGDGMIMYLKI